MKTAILIYLTIGVLITWANTFSEKNLAGLRAIYFAYPRGGRDLVLLVSYVFALVSWFPVTVHMILRAK